MAFGIVRPGEGDASPAAEGATYARTILSTQSIGTRRRRGTGRGVTALPGWVDEPTMLENPCA